MLLIADCWLLDVGCWLLVVVWCLCSVVAVSGVLCVVYWLRFAACCVSLVC